MKAIEKQITVNGKEITVYKINHDVNGNPRYVVHFLNLITEEDTAEMDKRSYKYGFERIDAEYNRAHARALAVGGRKYTANWFGGGFVFSSYNIADTLQAALNHRFK